MKLTEHNEKALRKFADMMIKRMEQMKSKNWEKGWIGRTFNGRPCNLEGRNYNGLNEFFLMMMTDMAGWQTPIFCTCLQANRLGAHINKGAISTPVMYWDFTAKDKDGHKISSSQYDQLTANEKANYKKVPFLKSFAVFNIDQTNINEVCPDKVKALANTFERPTFTDTIGMYDCPELDNMLDAQTWLCPIYVQEGDKACYLPACDFITVPTKAQFAKHKTKKARFADGQEFYSTLLHEMVHSTGSEKWLKRKIANAFGSDEYAREELVAELGAARVSQVLGFDKRILSNSAAYLNCWIKKLSDDPTFILSVMADMDKATRLILPHLAA